MGNSNLRTTLAPQQDPKIFFQADLPKFVTQSKIGNGKFMKSWLMRADGVPLMVKVYIRANTQDDEIILQKYALKLSFIWKNLSPAQHPYLMPYQVWIRSTSRPKGVGSPVYLIRQYLNANLYDRLSTRPFLHDFEKLWIVFQLFKCLEVCHYHKVVHGDVKPENVMCTSWNWVVLTDFALFKPVVIPDNDPSDFQYFFDTMGRRRCSVAPERFVKSNSIPSGKYSGDDYTYDSKDYDISSKKSSPKIGFTYAMDVFSLGCTIAEIFLDGNPLLDLPGMLKYLSVSQGSTSFERLDQEDSPAKAAVDRISNKLIRKVVLDMTQRDPDRRLTAKEYRYLLQNGITDNQEDLASNNEQLRIFNDPMERIKPTETAFPPYFEQLLYPLFLRLHYQGITPDDRIAILCQSYGSIITSITSESDDIGNLFFSSALNDVCSTVSPNASDNTGNISENNDHIVKDIKKASLYKARKRESLVGRNDEFRQLLSDFPDEKLRNSDKSRETKSEPSKKSSTSMEELISKCRSFMIDIEKKYGDLESKSSAPCYESTDTSLNAVSETALRISEGDSNESSFLNPWGHNSLQTKIGSTDSTETKEKGTICNGFVIIIQIIVSQFRSLKYPQSRIISLMLLVRLGLRCSDDVIIQKVIPILTQSLDDSNGSVRASAIRCLRALLKVIRVVSSFESNIFTNYIFPSLSKLAKDSEVIVRVAFAEAIGVVAETCKRFLDRAQLAAQNRSIAESISKDLSNKSTNASSTSQDNKISNNMDETSIDMSADKAVNATLVEFPYDLKLKQLHEQISRWIRDLILDGNSLDYRRGSGLSSHESIIKRAILVDMMRLCVFFGQESTMDLLLTQLLTFLNDQDWELRYAFCAKIASVCSFLGRTVTSECVLPCIENALVDVEEKVVARAVQCLDTLVNSQLLSNVVIVELVDYVTPLLLHPSQTVRKFVKELLASISKTLGSVYTAVFLIPKLWPNFIKYELVGVLLTEEMLTLALVSPIPRRIFRKALIQRQKQLLPPNNGDISSYSVITPSSYASQGTLSQYGITNTANISYNPNERESEIGFGIGSSILDGLGLAAELVAEAVIAAQTGSATINNTALTPKSPLNPRVKARPEAIMPELATIADESEEDKQKLAIIKTYLDRAAQEMSTKTKQWRTGMNAGTSATGFVVTLGRLQTTKDSTNTIQLDSVLEVSSSSLPDHSLQTILVPHQKYGVGYFPSIPEDTRREYAENIENVKTINELRTVFGLITKQSDVIRAIQAANLAAGSDQVTPLLVAEGLVSSGEADRSNQSQQNTSGNNNQNIQSINAAQSKMKILNTSIEVAVLVKHIKALNIPPLPPDVGTLVQPDERKYNCYIEQLDVSVAGDIQASRSAWRPKENILAATLIEHTAAVNRIAVSPDQTFFVTASSDKTAKVWQVKGLDRVAFPRSAMTYTKHAGAVIDAVYIENSHSIATSSDDGSVHVWRVDMASGNNSAPSDPHGGASDAESNHRGQGLTVSGYSTIKTLDPSEGAIISLQHFNSDICSVLVYASQRGLIHGWDLRSTKESFQYILRPELGYPTSSALSADRNWIAVGTNRGYIAVWDIRFNVMCKLFHHSSSSPINRLACSKFMPAGSKGNTTNSDAAYLIVASGRNETAIWGLPDGGECLKCFRAVPRKLYSSNEAAIAPLPILRPVPFSSHPLAPVVSIFDHQKSSDFMKEQQSLSHPSVRSIIGRISQSAESYLMTGGTDRQIRLWDFLSPAKCYSVSGVEPAQQKPLFEAPDGYGGRLFMSYDTEVPSADTILQAQLPVREGRGPVPPSNNFKDAILDMKNLDMPTRLLLSSSRDGTVKLWR